MKSTGIALLLILVLLLAGCSTTSQVPTAPTSLHVTRSESIPGYNFAPFERTVYNAEAVQRLYAAALALPAPQPGAVYDCPEDIGLVYHLSFRRDTSTLQQIDLEATGCGWLHLNQTTVRLVNSSFLSLVTQTIDIPCLVPTACGAP